MARSRRRRAPMVRKSRRRADWVYRHHAYTPIGGAADSLGTYAPRIITQVSGIATAQSHVLYDSQNWLATSGQGGINTNAVLSRSGRAEGRNPTILATEGIIYVEPSTWAIGNLIAYGWRLGVWEQDLTGVFSLDPQYSMWVESAPGPVCGQWANNGRNNAAERRIHYGFSDNQAFMVLRVKWRGRRILKPNECWGIYTELESTSVNVRQQFWLRSLVEDEN